MSLELLRNPVSFDELLNDDGDFDTLVIKDISDEVPHTMLLPLPLQFRSCLVLPMFLLETKLLEYVISKASLDPLSRDIHFLMHFFVLNYLMHLHKVHIDHRVIIDTLDSRIVCSQIFNEVAARSRLYRHLLALLELVLEFNKRHLLLELIVGSCLNASITDRREMGI